MEYIHDFKLDPFEFISTEWQRPFEPEQYMTSYIRDWQSIFNDRTVRAFEKQKTQVMVFNKPSDWNVTSKGNSVHIDENGIMCALNIVLPTDDNMSTMQWFDTDISREDLMIGSNSNYSKRWTQESWKPEEFRLVHEEFIDNSVCLVNTDVPHKVVVSQSARVCVSVRFRDIMRLRWKDALFECTRIIDDIVGK